MPESSYEKNISPLKEARSSLESALQQYKEELISSVDSDIQLQEAGLSDSFRMVIEEKFRYLFETVETLVPPGGLVGEYMIQSVLSRLRKEIHYIPGATSASEKLFVDDYLSKTHGDISGVGAVARNYLNEHPEINREFREGVDLMKSIVGRSRDKESTQEKVLAKQYFQKLLSQLRIDYSPELLGKTINSEALEELDHFFRTFGREVSYLEQDYMFPQKSCDEVAQLFRDAITVVEEDGDINVRVDRILKQKGFDMFYTLLKREVDKHVREEKGKDDPLIVNTDFSKN